MRIQHNIMAMNAYRNLNINNRSLSGNLEKLSSGYKINRAGDDAAGLAISEKMRAQITALDAAQKNVNDGISLVKTAEGAMQEIQDMLNRMEYLATQSANGTYDNEVDRDNLQKEVESLRSEIDRIAKASNFNGTKLLDGSLESAKVTTTKGVEGSSEVTAEAGVYTYKIDTAFVDGDKLEIGGKTITFKNGTGADIDISSDDDAAKQATAIKNLFATDANWTVTVNNDTLTFTQKTADASNPLTATPTGTGAGTLTETTPAVTGADAVPGTAASTEIDFTGLTADRVLGGTLKIGGNTYEFVTDEADVTGTNKAVVIDAKADAATIAGKLEDAITAAADTALDDYTVSESDGKVTIAETLAAGAKADAYDGAAVISVTQNNIGGLKLQIGDTSDDYNQMTVKVGDMHTEAMGSFGDDGTLTASIKDIDISTQSGAAKAVEVIKDAINYVSSVRGDLGAIQNRLEHTNNNLAVMEENIQDAESTIRDTDIADEMMAYTKNNILIQSAQAMLAQANQVPQGVLQLMQ